MANRLFKQFQGTLEAGVIKLYGSVTTSTSGTVSSSTGKGLTITKTSAETGRYTVTLDDKYTSLLAVSVTVQGAADAAYGTGKGLVSFVRGVDVAGTTPLFYIQFCDADGSPADAELEDGAKFYLEVTLKNSSAY
jgi:hypothetical protein